MRRERALKIVLVVGLLFTALVYPLALFVKQEPALAMMMSLYVTLGIFLLLAVRDPFAHRSLIAFTAWSSFAHAAVMGVQAFRNWVARGELIGVAALVVIASVCCNSPFASEIPGDLDSSVASAPQHARCSLMARFVLAEPNSGFRREVCSGETLKITFCRQNF